MGQHRRCDQPPSHTRGQETPDKEASVGAWQPVAVGRGEA